MYAGSYPLADSDGSETYLGLSSGGLVKRYVKPSGSGSGYGYNVRDYGAVGDGTTNDTAAIQAAIDAAEAVGRGVIYFPPGEYHIQPTLLTSASDPVTYVNLISNPETFNTWSATATTITANNETNYDGLTTADTVAATGTDAVVVNFTGASHGVVEGFTYRMTWWVKKGTTNGADYAEMTCVCPGVITRRVSVNLTTGSFVEMNGGPGFTTVTAVANGFWKVTLDIPGHIDFNQNHVKPRDVSSGGSVTIGKTIILGRAEFGVVTGADTWTDWALLVSGNNIALRGEPGSTKLTFYNYDGTVPEDAWPVFGGLVRRGSAIVIPGTTVPDNPQHDVTIYGFDIDGQAGYTANDDFPASPITGDGWDSSHHAIKLRDGADAREIVIERCNLHAWRGEIVIMNGGGIQTLYIRDCVIGDTNADGVSLGTTEEFICERNKFYVCNNAAAENTTISGRQVYRHNYIEGGVGSTGSGGIQAFPVEAGFDYGTTEIYSNHFFKCAGGTASVYIPAGNNTRIYDNLFEDCNGVLTQTGHTGGGGAGNTENDTIEIYNNHAIARTGYVEGCVSASMFGSIPFRNLYIHDNKLTSSHKYRAANPGSSGVGQCVAIGGGTTSTEGIRIERNYTAGGSSYESEETHSGEILLSTTGLTQLAANGFSYDTMRQVSVSFLVSNAPTTLTLHCNWFPASGGGSVTEVLASASQTLGWHHVSVVVPAGGNVVVQATAGTANNIKIFTAINDLGPALNRV